MEGLKPGDPERVGRYRLLNRLGAGGMGNVYLGQSPSGRLVAVKIIRPELADDPAFRQRFAQEVTAARRVGGMFTAPVVDADPDATQPWMVTAFVSGPSLADTITSLGPLPVRSVLLLAAGLAEGLGAVHAAGLVHRDLKPSNVLLASDGPRIIDFGISRAADSAALTRVGGVIGSPGFMSPEQAEGQQVEPASDIFSLGSVLAFAATGSPPFGEGPPSALLYRVVRGQPALDSVPAELRPLIERCMAKDPAARPSTDDLLSELGYPEPSEDWLSWHAAAKSDTVPPASEPSQSAVAAGAAPGIAAAPEAGIAAGRAASIAAAPGAGIAAGRAAGIAAAGILGAAIGAELADAAAATVAGAGGEGAAVGASRALALDDRPAEHNQLAREDPRSGQPVADGRDAAQAGGRGGAAEGEEPGDSAAAGPGDAGKRKRLPPWLGAAAILSLAAALLVAIALAGHPKPSRQPGASGSSVPARPAARSHRPGQTGSHAPGNQPGQAAAGSGATTAAAAGSAGPGQVPSAPATSQPASGASPVTVITAYYTAINNKEWNLVWALGGKNLYSSYLTMVADLTDITQEYVTIISTSGETVVARVRSVTIAGLTLIHVYSYVVQGGTIISGILESGT